MSRKAHRDDVLSLYAVLLGRRPESDAIVEQYSSFDFEALVAALLRSKEFSVLLAGLEARDSLSHFQELDAEDLTAASDWLATLGVEKPGGWSGWWSLLEAALSMDVANEVVRSTPTLARDVGLVTERADTERRTAALTAGLYEFDQDWFARYYPALALLRDGDAARVDAASIAAVIRRNQPLLPWFSTGLSGMFRTPGAENLSLPSLLHRYRVEAEAGKIGHWLFDRNTYLRSLTVAEEDNRVPSTVGSDPNTTEYVGFLSAGDAVGISPHPLFSYYAYKELNSSVDLSREPALFRHYLRRGIFDGLQTSAIFSEDYYLEMNPGARRDVLARSHVNGLHHFVTVGMNLGLSFSPDFDRELYLETYPEIAGAVARKEVPSAEAHFVTYGLAEDRRPNPYFDPSYYRERYPLSVAEGAKLGLGSLLEHFLLIGRLRGYRATRPLISTKPDLTTAKAIFQRRARRSFASIMSEGLDWGSLTLGPIDVSIIVPVCNQVDFTALFLQNAFYATSFLKSAGSLAAEVIVVDNGSTDATPGLLGMAKGISVVRTEHPVGFPSAVNKGAAVAQGDVLIIANNVIEFQPYAFWQAVEFLRRNPDCGVVGAKLILPNETLQNLGEFLEADGSSQGLGRADEPWDRFYSRPVTADYASGCFFGVRRSEYETLDGLDEAFSPGYFEEVDFAIRMRKALGKSTIVEPRIEVVHFEHASFAKGRPPATNLVGIRRNRTLLRRKHGDELKTRPATSDLSGPSGVRPHFAGRSRLLIIEDLIPDERLGSGFGREAEILRVFKTIGVPFDILALNSSDAVDEFKDPQVRVHRGWMRGEDFESLMLARGGAYSHFWVCRTHNLSRLAAPISAARQRWGTKIICDTEALGLMRDVEIAKLSGVSVSEDEILRAVQTELESGLKLDLVVAVNQRERALLERSGVGPLTVIGHHVSTAKSTNREWRQRNRVLALGAVHSADAPNLDALNWFITKVMPKSQPAFQNLTLTIAGHWRKDLADAFRQRHSNTAMEFLGGVSNERLSELYEEARLAIAPTRFAAGVPCKVIEAMLYGVPIVISDLLAEQLDLDSSSAVDLAIGSRFDDGLTFAKHVEGLATNSEQWARTRQRQLEIANGLCDARTFEKQVLEAISIADIITPVRGESLIREK